MWVLIHPDACVCVHPSLKRRVYLSICLPMRLVLDQRVDLARLCGHAHDRYIDRYTCLHVHTLHAYIYPHVPMHLHMHLRQRRYLYTCICGNACIHHLHSGAAADQGRRMARAASCGEARHPIPGLTPSGFRDSVCHHHVPSHSPQDTRPGRQC